MAPNKLKKCWAQQNVTFYIPDHTSYLDHGAICEQHVWGANKNSTRRTNPRTFASGPKTHLPKGHKDFQTHVTCRQTYIYIYLHDILTTIMKTEQTQHQQIITTVGSLFVFKLFNRCSLF